MNYRKKEKYKKRRNDGVVMLYSPPVIRLMVVVAQNSHSLSAFLSLSLSSLSHLIFCFIHRPLSGFPVSAILLLSISIRAHARTQEQQQNHK